LFLKNGNGKKYGEDDLNKIFFIFLVLSIALPIFAKDKGLKLYEKGEMENALKYYQEYLNKYQDDPAALYNKGTILYNMKRL
jgi:tetratricopeptide (TPR) repeat protein